MKNLKNKDFLVLVHGNMTSMTTKNRLPNEIKDELGYSFKVIPEWSYQKILNSKQIGLFDNINKLLSCGINQFYFDISGNAKKWIDIYSKIVDGEKVNVKKLSKGFTLGHFKRGVY